MNIHRENMGVPIFLIGVGILAIIMGIVVKRGYKKAWWLMWDTPITPLAAAYLGVPFGIGLIVFTISLLLPDLYIRRKVFGYGLSIIFISYILAMWRPRWLVPRWLLWLEDNHGEIYHQLRAEAQKLGAREWEKRVSTQEGLEEWAMEVRRKYGWDHPDAKSPHP